MGHNYFWMPVNKFGGKLVKVTQSPTCGNAIKR